MAITKRTNGLKSISFGILNKAGKPQTFVMIWRGDFLAAAMPTKESILVREVDVDGDRVISLAQEHDFSITRAEVESFLKKPPKS